MLAQVSILNYCHRHRYPEQFSSQRFYFLIHISRECFFQKWVLKGGKASLQISNLLFRGFDKKRRRWRRQRWRRRRWRRQRWRRQRWRRQRCRGWFFANEKNCEMLSRLLWWEKKFDCGNRKRREMEKTTMIETIRQTE